MTVEEYFEEWWTPKELPENGFNKIAMLNFAEMYHKQTLNIHDVVGRSEQLIDFLLHLNDKGLINNYDFDYEKEAKKYLKKN